MSKAAYGSEADIVIYGTLIVVAIIVVIIIWMNVHTVKGQEKQGIDLTVDEILLHYSRRLLSKYFLWGIWQGRLSLDKMQLFVKNERGEEVATITYHYIPTDGVLKTIDMKERKYECISAGALSNKTLLRGANSGQILMSCEHKAMKQIYYEGEGDRVKFTLHHTSVFKDASPIKAENTEIGQFISMYKFKCDAMLLNLPEKNITLAERLFIFASILRG